MRILTVFGTRPEAIKLAPIIRLLAGSAGVESLVCVTAQHRQMLDQILELFRIRPDVDDPARVVVTGDTVIDALMHAVARLDAEAELARTVSAALPRLDPDKRLILVTGHRRENFADGLARVATGLRQLAARGDVELVYPVHLNPQVQQWQRRSSRVRPSISSRRSITCRPSR